VSLLSFLSSEAHMSLCRFLVLNSSSNNNGGSKLVYDETAPITGGGGGVLNYAKGSL
jgi:hypothetical protein